MADVPVQVHGTDPLYLPISVLEAIANEIDSKPGAFTSALDFNREYCVTVYVAARGADAVWRFTTPIPGTQGGCTPNFVVSESAATVVLGYNHNHPDITNMIEGMSSADLAVWPPEARAQFNPRVAMTPKPLIATMFRGAPIPFANYLILKWDGRFLFLRAFTDGTVQQHVGTGETWTTIGRCRPFPDRFARDPRTNGPMAPICNPEQKVIEE